MPRKKHGPLPTACPKCGSANFTTAEVEERPMHRCRDCVHQWYTFRTVGSPYFEIVDRIADDVAQSGTAEIETTELVNNVWPRDQFQSKLVAWCLLHGFTHSFVDRPGGGQIVRLTRRLPR